MAPCEGENLDLSTTVAIVTSLPEDRVLPCCRQGYIVATDYIAEAVGGDLRAKKKDHLKTCKRICAHVH